MRCHTPLPPRLETALAIYRLAFRAALPLLRLNRRLSDGFSRRSNADLPRAELWMHAASAGECLLAGQILARLDPGQATHVLITTQTSQGLALAQGFGKRAAMGRRHLTVKAAYLPFDQPRQMQRAVAAVRPRLVVLLETELWPGWLAALKRARVPVMLLNGRLTERSLRRYRITGSLWPPLRPQTILAVSPQDAQRFGQLFGRQDLAVMPNMKFDQFGPGDWAEKEAGPLAALLADVSRFLVFGSTRRQEESRVEALLLEVRRRAPAAVIGLFPRHMERLAHWQRRLDRLGIPWRYRSQARPPVTAGEMLLWDRFGELTDAYGLAHGAFVGGSLVPLGGQNFLEALRGGVLPVIGPHWDNFAWVGRDLLHLGLVRQADNWQQAAALLCNSPAPLPRAAVRSAARQYFDSRGGGSDLACALIARRLKRLRDI